MPEEKEHIEQLDDFLKLVKEELSTIIKKRQWELPKELQDYAAAAWGEVEGAIETARTQLSGISNQELEKVGLTGNSLKLKIAGFMLSRANGVTRRIFRWMNIILGSLCRALPVLEPVREFKEALEESLPK